MHVGVEGWGLMPLIPVWALTAMSITEIDGVSLEG